MRPPLPATGNSGRIPLPPVEDMVATRFGSGKVRTSQGGVVDNVHRKRFQGKCHRKHTAVAARGCGKGEMVR